MTTRAGPRVPARHAAHRPDEPVVERAQPREQILGEAPALRTVKEDIDDQRHVCHLLGLERDVLRLEDLSRLSRLGSPLSGRHRVAAAAKFLVRRPR